MGEWEKQKQEDGEPVAVTGTVPMPSRVEKMLGGHAVLTVGQRQRRFKGFAGLGRLESQPHLNPMGSCWMTLSLSGFLPGRKKYVESLIGLGGISVC